MRCAIDCGTTLRTADPRAERRPSGESGDAPHSALHPSRVEILETEHARVMAQLGGLRDQIARLKKLLWREAMRHRRAHRYTLAKDIEVSLHRMDAQ